MPRAYYQRLSLKQKLPLLICGLLLGVILLFAGATYRSVENASLAVGRERLRSVTNQLGDLLNASMAVTEKRLRATSGDSAFAKFIRSPTPANKAAALAVMRKGGADTLQRIVSELWSPAHELLLSTGLSETVAHGNADAEIDLASRGPRFLAIGRFRVEHDTVVMPVVSAVPSIEAPLGYFVEWRRVAGTAKARDPLLQLIGPNAALLVGNDSGGVWTDLVTTAHGPPINVRQATDVVGYTRADGTQVFGRARAIAGTPWYVVVELSRDAVLATSTEFVRRSAIIALVVLAIGFAVAWSLSRSITLPLKSLTDASSAIAAGDYSHVVPVGRTDELGQLAAAFNTMAGQVRDTRTGLEERVLERTQKLEQLQVVMLRTERLNTLATLGAGLAHDLNNLLFSISLAADSMERDAAGEHIDRGALLGRIKKASSEAGRLTKQLMSFARGDMGSSPPKLVEISRAVAAQEELLRMLLPRTVGLRMSIETNGQMVMMPATLIEQSLVNLVSNARDAMVDGGIITVSVREEPGAKPKSVVVEVADTGHGIDPEIHESIFETFFSTKAEKGTGIGLASVRALMESVGGTVTVHSAPGQGATFRLSFPLVDERAHVPDRAGVERVGLFS
jgi:signal transduction histidine kinase